MADEVEAGVQDPNGVPRGMSVGPGIVWSIARFGLAGLTIVTGGTLALVVLGAVPQRTMGALRSHHVAWQQRQEEIEAVRGDEAKPVAAVECSTDVASGEGAHD